MLLTLFLIIVSLVAACPAQTPAAHIELSAYKLSADSARPVATMDWGIEILEPELERLGYSLNEIRVPDTSFHHLYYPPQRRKSKIKGAPNLQEETYGYTLSRAPQPNDGIEQTAYSLSHGDNEIFRFYEEPSMAPYVMVNDTAWVVECFDLKLPGDDLRGGIRGRGMSIVMNGTDLNSAQHYSASFGFHVLKGEPLWFFKRDGGYGVCYAGGETALLYDSLLYDQPEWGDPLFGRDWFGVIARADSNWNLVIGKVTSN